jgi:hypothetical protein
MEESIIGDRNPRFGLYDPATLEALGQAYNAAWLVLRARDPFRDFESDSDLKATLSRKLLALAANGVTDAVELREGAVEG